ncbi:DUF2797 domain-containing protein [Vibrio fujianensis]|uniref:DUF2797 domain-containing protein n=1 Tax=Vibrio fujianensis TaxID=1974215 RepID=UPI000C166F6F|nr:DUF2797 domain-containing protein [Vibrio fujianensis]
MSFTVRGVLNKMRTHLNPQVQYQLPVGEHLIDLNPLIGKTLTLQHTGHIYCCACGKKTKKSYSQGHCFLCMKKLASCDMCIMKPETCHFDQGTCREPEWAQTHCMVDHYVYLANTSSLKVGITRHNQIPTRWIDQGATQGLAIYQVKNRHISGLIEIELAKHIADKTNWRTLLKKEGKPLPLLEQAETLKPLLADTVTNIKQQFGKDAVTEIYHTITDIEYPVQQHPEKIISHNFDKQPLITGRLQGIKGQYLMFDTGAINIRKFTSYEVEVSA